VIAGAAWLWLHQHPSRTAGQSAASKSTAANPAASVPPSPAPASLPPTKQIPSFNAETRFKEIPAQPAETAMMDSIEDLQFSADGRLLWISGEEPTPPQSLHGFPKIQIWDTRDFTLSREIPGWARHLALSPDGKLFAHDWWNVTRRQYPDIAVPGAPDQSQVLVRDVGTGEAIRGYGSPEKDFEALAFHPNSQWIAIGDAACCALPNYLAVWDVVSGRMLYELKGLKNSDMFIRFSPDGSLLAIAAKDVTVWGANDGNKIKTLDPAGDITDLQFSPDGQLLAASYNRSGKIRLWHTSDWTESGVLPGESYYDLPRIAFSPDSRLLVSIGHPNGVRIWYVPEKKIIQKISEKEAFHANRVTFDPLGRFFVMTQFRRKPYVALWAPLDASH
jgi:WD40 repeat protein